MPLDPNIALQVRPFQMESPVNVMSKMYQLQGAQQANQLNAMQMAEYERARQEEEGVRNYLAGADIKAPETRAKLTTAFGKTGLGYAKTIAEQEAAMLKQKIDQLKYTTDMTEAAASIYGTVKDEASWQAAKPKLAALGGDPSKLPVNYDPNFVNQEKLAATKVKDQLTLFAPKPKEVKRGDGSIIFLDENPNSPTYGKEVLPKQAAGMTPYETENLSVQKNQFNLAAAKFNWEKANPGMSIQEDANGLLAVNTRTGVATPVVYGPMGFQSPQAAAPVGGQSVMRQQGTGMPTQRIPAVPGMTSVLDQNVAPAAPMPLPAEGGARVPGAPVGAKERNLPEHFVKTDMQLANLAGSVRAFKDEVAKNKNTSAKWLPTGADTANMQAKYISLLMGVKDLYTLGALTGPDLSLIEAQITNPASWTGKFTTKAGFESQIKVIEDMVDRGAKSLENSYGKVPKATKAALQSSPPSGGGGIPGATATNPLGLTIPGVR